MLDLGGMIMENDYCVIATTFNNKEEAEHVIEMLLSKNLQHAVN